MNKKVSHSIFYFFEFIIIGLCFAIILTFPLSFYMQLFILGITLVLYISIGLWHHKLHHDIKGKVVLEYILISVLMFSLFIFLNVSKL